MRDVANLIPALLCATMLAPAACSDDGGGGGDEITPEMVNEALLASDVPNATFAVLGTFVDLLDHDELFAALNVLAGDAPPLSLDLPRGGCPDASFERGVGLRLEWDDCENRRGIRVDGAITVSRHEDGESSGGEKGPAPVVGLDLNIEDGFTRGDVGIAGSVLASIQEELLSLDALNLEVVLGGGREAYRLDEEIDPSLLQHVPNSNPIGDVLEIPLPGFVAEIVGDAVHVHGGASMISGLATSPILIPGHSLEWSRSNRQYCLCPDGGEIEFFVPFSGRAAVTSINFEECNPRSASIYNPVTDDWFVTPDGSLAPEVRERWCDVGRP